MGEVRDKLRDELEQYHPDHVLFDGFTAVESLRKLINTPYQAPLSELPEQHNDDDHPTLFKLVA